MSQASTNTDKTLWQISQSLGQVTSSDVSKTITLSTAGRYVDKDIEITVSATGPGAATETVSGLTDVSATGTSIAPGSVTLATDSTSVTGKTRIASAPTTDSSSLTGEYYIAVKPKVASSGNKTASVSGTATATVTKGGYVAKDATFTGTASASITISSSAKNGSVYYLPLTSGVISTAEKNADGLTTNFPNENTTAIVPTEGYLTLSAGYYPATRISLATLVPNSYEGKTISATSSMKAGYYAWDNDGKAIVGALAKLTNTSFSRNASSLGGGTATISGPTWNDTNWTITSSGSASATITTTSKAEGWVENGTAVYSGTVSSGSISGSKTLAVIAGSTSISEGSTFTPVVSRSAFTISGVSDAASGAAVNSAPTSGVYVKVSTASQTTKTITATPSVTTAGYGTSDHHFISGNSTTVSLAGSGDYYVPIKTTTATAKTAPVASAATGSTDAARKVTLTEVSLAPSSGFYITAGATAGATTVSSAGWISSGDTSTGAATTKYYTLKTAALTHSGTAITNVPTVTLKRTAGSVTSATSGDYYITVGKDGCTDGSVTHAASVSEGYVPAAGLSANATITTSANATAKTFYFASTAITGSVSASLSGATTGYSDPVTTTASSSVPQLRLTGNGSATSGSVYNGTATAANKYINYYTGIYSVSE